MVGNRTRVRVLKNKLAPPFKEAEFDIMYGEGISHTGDVLDIAAGLDIVAKSGAWYSYGDMRLGQGRENAKDFLRQNPELLMEIERKVKVHYGLIQEEPDKDDKKAEPKNQKPNNPKERAVRLLSYRNYTSAELRERRA